MNNFMAYSRVYKDYKDLYSTDKKKVKTYYSLYLGTMFILTVASLVWFIRGLETGYKYSDASFFTASFFLVVLIVSCVYCKGMLDKVDDYNLNLSYLEKFNFENFKDNYIFLNHFILSMRSRDRYRMYMAGPTSNFINEQYIDIVLNRFYSGIDSDYYSIARIVGTNIISLYGNDLISLDSINSILGDYIYGYAKVAGKLKK